MNSKFAQIFTIMAASSMLIAIGAMIVLFQGNYLIGHIMSVASFTCGFISCWFLLFYAISHLEDRS